MDLQQTHHPKVWTTRSLLEWMTSAFTQRKIDSPRLCAEMLLSHVIGCERLRLYMEVDRPATALERDLLRALVGRALGHEPVQYLVNEGWFFSLPFHVDRRVLVPRPSTETILEHALQTLRADPSIAPGGRVSIADVCTGSGAIAIALLKNLPDARAIACDLSPDALEVARLNASRHGVADRLDLVQGDLLEPIRSMPGGAGGGLHLLVSNPPYIPDHEWEQVAANVRDYEPEIALRGGADGLRFVRPLIEQAPPLMAPGGILMIELASSSAPEALVLANTRPELRDAMILDDFEGLPRVLAARKA